MKCPSCSACEWDELQHHDPDVVVAVCRRCALRIEFHQHEMIPCGEQFELFNATEAHD